MCAYGCLWASHLTPTELCRSQHGLTGMQNTDFGGMGSTSVPRPNTSWELCPHLLSNYGFLSKAWFCILRISLLVSLLPSSFPSLPPSQGLLYLRHRQG